MIELRRKGKAIPTDVFEDLKAAKILISISKVDSSSRDATNVEYYLGKVESYLLSLAEDGFGKEYAEDYLEKIRKARTADVEERTQSFSSFFQGIPRGEDWIRLKMEDLVDCEKVEEIANNLGLSYRQQREGFLLVHGEGEKIRLLVKKVVEETKKSKKDVD